MKKIYFSGKNNPGFSSDLKYMEMFTMRISGFEGLRYSPEDEPQSFMQYYVESLVHQALGK